jgi:hypothetical protein
MGSTLAMVSRQEGGISRRIDDLSQSLCSRWRTSHVPPAGSHHMSVSSRCTTLFEPGLAPRGDPAMSGYALAGGDDL